MITITEIGDYDETKPFGEQSDDVRSYILGFITDNTPTSEIKEFCGKNVNGKDIYRIKECEFTDNNKSIKIILNNTFVNAPNNKRAFKVGKRYINIEEI